MQEKRKNTKPLHLALQGGGAHGAFTWGVLDKLLEDGRVDFETISATSAGSMNAVVASYGIAMAGHNGGRQKLEEFWQEISKADAQYSPLQRTPLEQLFNIHNLEFSPAFHWFEALTRVFSPYQLNPLNFNPLKDILNKVVDFENLNRSKKAIKLFLAATNVHTGRSRVFSNEEISADVVLASACLPFMFQAVEIGGEHYWDGGYVANPALYPLFDYITCKDVLIVHINPLYRDEAPYTAPDIYNRINEISFNASLMNELRSIAFVKDLIHQGRLDKGRKENIRVHAISRDTLMTKLGVSSKLVADWPFLCYLRDEGRLAAEEWLEECYEHIGKESSLDIRGAYL